MRIHVIGPVPRFVERIRAYAEYRIFSELAPLARDVASVRVVVRQSPAGGVTSCCASADLGAGRRVQVRSRRAQPTGAIDAAAERLSAAAARRLTHAE